MAKRPRRMAKRLVQLTKRLGKVAERLFEWVACLRQMAAPLRLDCRGIRIEPERLRRGEASRRAVNLAPFTLLIGEGAISSDGFRRICGGGLDDVAPAQEANRRRRRDALRFGSAPRAFQRQEESQQELQQQSEHPERGSLSGTSAP
jgi:hypothetical protein